MREVNERMPEVVVVREARAGERELEVAEAQALRQCAPLTNATAAFSSCASTAAANFAASQAMRTSV